MKVIFLQDDKGIKKGTVKDVSDGFAKNYLIPNNVAVQATPENLRKLAAQQAQTDAQNAHLEAEALELIALLASKEVVLSRKRAGNRMVQGSITKANISEAALNQLGITIDSKNIVIDRKYFCFGTFDAVIKLGGGREAKLKVRTIEE